MSSDKHPVFIVCPKELAPFMQAAEAHAQRLGDLLHEHGFRLCPETCVALMQLAAYCAVSANEQAMSKPAFLDLAEVVYTLSHAAERDGVSVVKIALAEAES